MLCAVVRGEVLTAIIEKNYNCSKLCGTFAKAATFLTSDTILIPYINKKHWSVAMVYMQKRVIVYCDCTSEKVNEEETKVFGALVELVGKLYACRKRRFDVTKCKLIAIYPAQEAAQKGTSKNSAFYAAVYAFSLLSFQDFAIKSEYLPSIRYWVFSCAINFMWHDKYTRPERKQLPSWKSLPKVDKNNLNISQIEFGNGIGPFAALRRLLADI